MPLCLRPAGLFDWSIQNQSPAEAAPARKVTIEEQKWYAHPRRVRQQSLAQQTHPCTECPACTTYTAVLFYTLHITLSLVLSTTGQSETSAEL